MAVLAAATAAAQTSGGVIRGTISDPFDALVPGAAITIEKVSTGEKWSLLSSCFRKNAVRTKGTAIRERYNNVRCY